MKHQHPFCPMQQEQATYRQSSRLFREMDHLRSVWDKTPMMPPLKRSELGLLGVMMQMDTPEGRPVTISRLSRHMGRSMPGISQKVSVLEKQGYLRRTAHSGDRRVVGLELTDEGRAIASHSIQDFLGRMEEALDEIGPEKTEALLTLMNQLSTAIEAVQARRATTQEDKEEASL